MGSSSGPGSSYDYSFKILLIGDSGVGKSSLLVTFISNQLEDLSPTIGVDFKVKFLTIGGKKLKLTIWDTAGQERFRTVTSSYYRGAQGILLVYDVTRRETFTNLADVWAKEVELYSTNRDCIKILIGNKLTRAVVFDKAIDALTGLLMLCQGFFDVLVVIQRKGRRMEINKIENTKPVVLWGKKEYIQIAQTFHCLAYLVAKEVLIFLREYVLLLLDEQLVLLQYLEDGPQVLDVLLQGVAVYRDALEASVALPLEQDWCSIWGFRWRFGSWLEFDGMIHLPPKWKLLRQFLWHDILEFCQDRLNLHWKALLLQALVAHLADGRKESERMVTREEGVSFAKESGCLFLECSAKTQENVEKCFEELVLKILEVPSLLEEGSAVGKRNILKQKQENHAKPNGGCCS
uniref:Ras-related protein RABC2a-like n=1 Tax=Ananas comosus var. bracteatus TaxID=296719 RepID=A0A6V7PGT8_ANACO|nr:unnamed protein product [Ananas comosus var. bracteatus]